MTFNPVGHRGRMNPRPPCGPPKKKIFLMGTVRRPWQLKIPTYSANSGCHALLSARMVVKDRLDHSAHARSERSGLGSEPPDLEPVPTASTYGLHGIGATSAPSLFTAEAKLRAVHKLGHSRNWPIWSATRQVFERRVCRLMRTLRFCPLVCWIRLAVFGCPAADQLPARLFSAGAQRCRSMKLTTVGRPPPARSPRIPPQPVLS